MKFRHKVYPNCLFKTDQHKVKFTDGEAFTEHTELIRSLQENPDIEMIVENKIDDDLNKFTVKELKNIAKEKGLAGIDSLKKDELIKKIEKSGYYV